LTQRFSMKCTFRGARFASQVFHHFPLPNSRLLSSFSTTPFHKISHPFYSHNANPLPNSISIYSHSYSTQSPSSASSKTPSKSTPLQLKIQAFQQSSILQSLHSIKSQYTSLSTSGLGQLMRLDKPTGTFLLFAPCLLSSTLAIHLTSSSFLLHIPLFTSFFIGSLLLRGAGCVINDIIDRDFDKHVKRTSNRPLVTGAVSLPESILFFCTLSLSSLPILFILPKPAQLLALSGFFPAMLYPFAKRFHAFPPQFILALTFNIGALVGFASVSQIDSIVNIIGVQSMSLYAACVSWTLLYDTIYGHMDKSDDIKIGISNSALMLKPEKAWLSGFALVQIVCLGLCGVSSGLNWPFYVGLVANSAHLVEQIYLVDLNSRMSCQKAFKSSTLSAIYTYLGLIASLALN